MRLRGEAMKASCAIFASAALCLSFVPAAAFAASTDDVTQRIAGKEAYQTAIEIAREGFSAASSAILATDSGYQDALSAAGLAGTVSGPILTTHPNSLPSEVSGTLASLGVKKVYLIGGRAAVSQGVEDALKASFEVERVSGPNAWDTSVKCAESIERLGGNPKGEAIVATSGGFQDALSISPYAYRSKVPIFLETSAGQLPDEAKARIDAIKGTIYVPGGNGAVPKASVEGLFPSRSIVRISGATGYDTSNQIATYFARRGDFGKTNAVVASGSEGSMGLDALAGAALAGRAGCAILLVDSDGGRTVSGSDSMGAPSFVEANKATLSRIHVLGGKGALPESVVDALKRALGIIAGGAGSGGPGLKCYLGATSTYWFCVCCGRDTFCTQVADYGNSNFLFAKMGDVNPSDWPQYRFTPADSTGSGVGSPSGSGNTDCPGYWLVTRGDGDAWYHDTWWRLDEIDGEEKYSTDMSYGGGVRSHSYNYYTSTCRYCSQSYTVTVASVQAELGNGAYENARSRAEKQTEAHIATAHPSERQGRLENNSLSGWTCHAGNFISHEEFDRQFPPSPNFATHNHYPWRYSIESPGVSVVLNP